MLKGSRQKSSEQFGEAQNNIFRLVAKLLIPSQNHISSSIADLQSETKPMALRVKITNHPKSTTKPAPRARFKEQQSNQPLRPNTRTGRGSLEMTNPSPPPAPECERKGMEGEGRGDGEGSGPARAAWGASWRCSCGWWWAWCASTAGPVRRSASPPPAPASPRTRPPSLRDRSACSSSSPAPSVRAAAALRCSRGVQEKVWVWALVGRPTATSLARHNLFILISFRFSKLSKKRF